MKKVSVIIVVFILSIIGIYFLIPKNETKTIHLKEHEMYKDIKLSDIKNIEVIKYTEGGSDESIIADFDEIKSLYNKIINIEIGEETEMACEDNTTVYVINFNDKTSKKVEIECDWIIIGKKRYLIK